MKPGKAGPRRLRMLARRSNSTPAKYDISTPWLLLGFAFAGLLFFGAKTNFFASEGWAEVSAYAALFISLWLTLLSVRAARRSNFGHPQIRSGAIRIAAALVIVPAAAMFTTWTTLALGLPDVYTRIVGAQFAGSHELQKSWIDSHRGCDNRVLGTPFESGLHEYYCAGPEEFDRLPARGLMSIHGRQSWFGIHVDRIEPIDPEFHH